jgi:hypothetical protein
VYVVSTDGKPIGGAQVELVIGESRTIRISEKTGVATFPKPAIGQGRLTVQAPRFARKTVSITVDQRTKPIKVALAPGARLVGMIQDDLGAPIPAARLTFRLQESKNADPWMAQSDSQGRFELDTCEQGVYVVEAHAPAHERVVRPNVQVPTADLLLIELKRAAQLAGTVVGPDGLPAAGASVTFAGSACWPPQTVTCGLNGQFLITDLGAGIYEVRACLHGAVSEPVTDLSLEPGGARTVQLLLVAGRSIIVEVVDAASEKPICSAEVTVTEEALSFIPRVVKTGPDGRLRVDSLRQVSHRISIKAKGYVPIIREERTPSAEEYRFPLYRSSIVAGKVVDEDGNAIAGAQVEVMTVSETIGGATSNVDLPFIQQPLFDLPRSPSGATADRPLNNLGVTQGAVPPIPTTSNALSPKTDTASAQKTLEGQTPFLSSGKDGAFRIEGVTPGNIQVVARLAGYAPGISKLILLRPGSTVDDLVLTLPRGGTVEGRVVDYRGYPVADVRVEVRAERENIGRFALSGSDGGFEFEGVWGAVLATAYPPGLSPTSSKILVSMRQRYQIELVLQNRVNSLQGRVVDERGFPVSGAAIKIQSLKTDFPNASLTRSRADGTFAIMGLPEPPYKVAVQHPDYAQATAAPVAPSKREFVITLKRGTTLSGQVVDQWSRRPVAAARVTLFDFEGGFRGKTLSNKAGNFEYRNVASGNYYIISDKLDYVSNRKNLTVKPESVREGTYDLEPISLTPGGSVSGQVIDRIGSSVPSADVAPGEPPDWSRAVQTDGHGMFRIAGVAPGNAILSARHTTTGALKTEQQVRVYPLQETPGVIIQLPERLGEGTDDSEPKTEKAEKPALLSADDSEPKTEKVKKPAAIRFEYQNGAIVVQSVENSSAEYAAGLRVGDALLSVNGEPVYSSAQAKGMLQSPMASRITLAIRRSGRPMKFTLTRQNRTVLTR